MGEGRSLLKGQRLRLADLTEEQQLSVTVFVEGLPEPPWLFCLALSDQGQWLAPDGLLCPRAPELYENALSLVGIETGSRAFLNLATLPAAVGELQVCLALGDASRRSLTARAITTGRVTLEAGGTCVAEFTFTGEMFSEEKALLLLRFYRKGGWRLGVVADGYAGGWPGMRLQLGIPPLELCPPPPVTAEPPPETAEARASRLEVDLPLPLRLPARWPGNVQPSVPEGLIQATGMILIARGPDQLYAGTGFVITPGGHVLTCAHVVDGALKLSFYQGGEDRPRPLRVVAVDEPRDLALCWLADGQGSADWLLLAGKDEKPGLGEALGMLSYPLSFDLGLEVTYSQGMVNACRQKDQIPMLQIDVGATHGSSGGPLFRRSDGRVVGMVQSGIGGEKRGGMLINLALDVRALYQLSWLEGATDSPAGPPTPSPSPAE